VHETMFMGKRWFCIGLFWGPGLLLGGKSVARHGTKQLRGPTRGPTFPGSGKPETGGGSHLHKGHARGGNRQQFTNKVLSSQRGSWERSSKEKGRESTARWGHGGKTRLHCGFGKGKTGSEGGASPRKRKLARRS